MLVRDHPADDGVVAAPSSALKLALACQFKIASALVRPGSVVPMNFHFTTAKAHITRVGGRVEELVSDAGLQPESSLPFKGNIDLDKLNECIARNGKENVSFVRIEAGTNLIGGQPVSLENMQQTAKIARENGIPVVLDASLLQDNLHFIKVREQACKDMSIREITRDRVIVEPAPGRSAGAGNEPLSRAAASTSRQVASACTRTPSGASRACVGNVA